MARIPVLSPNGEKIIKQLLSLPGSWVTSALLADSIGISKRTIMRELPGVEAWMDAVGADFKKSPGKGMILSGDETQISSLKILIGDTNENLIMEKDIRVRELFFMLILSDEPVKQYYLSSALGVSERTLSSDLDQLAIWLEKQGLQLVRKSGIGVWLEGTGYQKRRAISQLLYHQYSREIMKTIFGEEGSLDSSDESFRKLLDGTIARKVKIILQEFEGKENLHFADAGFITLTLQLSLLVQDLIKEQKQTDERIRQENTILHCELEITELGRRMVACLEEAFEIKIHPIQAELISCYLHAYRNSSLEDGIEGSEMDVRYLGAMLIQYVEVELNVDLSRHQDLSDAMYNHLRAMLHRMRTDSYTENPQLEMFKQQYGWLWDIIRRACDAAYDIQVYPGLKPISDEEAAFLGMHFGAVLEKDDMALMRIKTVLVCPHGLASSRFLSSQINKEYPVLHIHGTCSVRELNEQYLREHGIDLLVSSVPLEISFPYVQVNTILQPIDHTILNETIIQCQQRIQEKIHARKQIASAQAKENLAGNVFARDAELRSRKLQMSVIRYAYQLTGLIIDFVDHLKLETASAVGKRAKLIQMGAGLFARDAQSADLIEAALLKREDLASTYIQPLHILLLHCKTSEIEGCRMGYVKAEPPVYEPGKVIQGAVVVMASEEADFATDIIRAVCGMLIDEPRLMDALNAKRLEEAKELVENGLELYFLHRFKEYRKKLK